MLYLQLNDAQAFKEEISKWEKLSHKNISQVLSVTIVEGLPCLVTEKSKAVTMRTFLKKHPDANLVELVRDRFMRVESLLKVKKSCMMLRVD